MSLRTCSRRHRAQIAQTDKPHTVAEIIAAVQARIDKDYTPFLYEAPNAPEQPATLRFIALEGAAAGPRIIDVLVDPVSLDFVKWHYDAFPGFLSVIVRLHGNLLMGRAGRVYVGWLGLAMLVLGISGLILWWPGRNRWRAAFLVKRGARGLRLCRDLHSAIGIWTFVVFITVSFSGVYFAFPEGAGFTDRGHGSSASLGAIRPIFVAVNAPATTVTSTLSPRPFSE